MKDRELLQEVLDLLVKNREDTARYLLLARQENKGAWVQEDLQRHDVAIAGLREALAHLAAKERSVQGWAVVGPDGKVLGVNLSEPFFTGDSYEVGLGFTCQPVTITINAAGQGSVPTRSEKESQVATEPQEGRSDSAPAAPVDATAWTNDHADEQYSMSMLASKEDLLRHASAPVAESAEHAHFAIPVVECAYDAVDRELPPVVYEEDARRAIKQAERLGIRKGLEMARNECSHAVSASDAYNRVQVLLDAQKALARQRGR